MTGSYEATGDSLSAWEAADKALDGYLKTLAGNGWNGYKTLTGYFTDPVATSGRVRYRVVLRGKLENADATGLPPRLARKPDRSSLDVLRYDALGKKAKLNSDASAGWRRAHFFRESSR